MNGDALTALGTETQPNPGPHQMPYWPTGTVYGTLLNFQGEREVQRATFALVSVDVLVDALVACTGLFVDQQVAADLLRTPDLFQFGLNKRPRFLNSLSLFDSSI